MDRLAMARRLGEELHGLVWWHIARLKVDKRGAAIVAGDEAVQDLGAGTGIPRPKPP